MSQNRKKLNEIFKKYKLNRSQHTFESDSFTIITRVGIKTIQQKEGIQLKYHLVYQDKTTVTVLVSGYFEGKEYQTYGEASPQNNTFLFPVAVAQKRAESRIILEMVGLYDYMGEDEIQNQPVDPRKLVGNSDKGKAAADKTFELMQNATKK